MIRFKPGDVMAGRSDALRRLGMSGECGVSERLEELCRRAETTFTTLARPTALFSEISLAEFESIYEGGGANAPETPLDVIYPRADALALFAHRFRLVDDVVMPPKFEIDLKRGIMQ